MGRRPSKKHTIERMDVNGDYCPENCIRATMKTQQRNRRNNVWVEYHGEMRLLAELAETAGINYYTFHDRIRRKMWTVEKAMETPVKMYIRRSK
jgi:hypothetical protein